MPLPAMVSLLSVLCLCSATLVLCLYISFVEVSISLLFPLCSFPPELGVVTLCLVSFVSLLPLLPSRSFSAVLGSLIFLRV